MSMTLNGSGSISGLVAGGLPDGTITTPDLADNTITNAKLAFDGGAFGFRNKIINGDMRIDQRNNGAAVTHSGSSNLYVIDRMVCNSTGTPQFSVQRVADAPAGFTYSAKLTTTTAGTPAAIDFSYFGQYIEGFNSADLAFGTTSAKTVTISFWVKSSLTGIFGGALMNGTINRAYPFAYTINSANTWEYKSITITGDSTGTWATDNTRGVDLLFDLGSGVNNKTTAGVWGNAAAIGVTGGTNLVATAAATWNITGIQLEAGSVATPFEARPYGLELALCQRYYWDSGSAVAGGYPRLNGYGIAGSAISTNIKWPVTMRTAPTVTVLTSAGWALTNCSAPVASASTAEGVFLAATITTTGAADAYAGTSNKAIIASAEL